MGSGPDSTPSSAAEKRVYDWYPPSREHYGDLHGSEVASRTVVR